MTQPVIPFSLKDAPALIERLLPVQKLSAEAYKEQMAGAGKTLTALGSYWKGRKPLILNKACILGSLLPATGDDARDLEIFEKLMAMDAESFAARWKRALKSEDILAQVAISRITDYFEVEPEGILPISAPVDWSRPEYQSVKVNWRSDISLLERRRLEAQLLPDEPYREWVSQSFRPEEMMDTVHEHIWETVNAHLATNAYSFPELVEQLGIMRFGHRPRLADTFCGSGQIPFEAARLGCNVYASDLNPVACMLTWGAFNIIGGSPESRMNLAKNEGRLIQQADSEIEKMGVEHDGQGWRAKVFLYCFEVRCPQTGWLVPLIPSLVISKPRTGNKINVIAELIPDPKNKRYDIRIRSGVTKKELAAAEAGTIGRESRFGDAYLIHQVNGVPYKTKISTLRGDYQKSDGTTSNRVRRWGKHDFKPQPDDIFQERLYCIQWIRPKKVGRGFDYEFRSVTLEDIKREQKVEQFIQQNLVDWQANGWIPDARIEPGGPPRYEGMSLIRNQGWTYWHHLFNPRQLLIAGLVNQQTDADQKFGFMQLLNYNSRLSRWDVLSGGGGSVKDTFYNQALNVLFSYGCRSFVNCSGFLETKGRSFPLDEKIHTSVQNHPVSSLTENADLFVSDPPYGDAVKYEEILDFFIAWLRKNPPPEFANWIWDSRRSLAIKGEDEDFRRGMVSAYARVTECMPDNGLQVIMFTHQSGSIWADMANIVWASGLQVTAAWYVVTETDSALREGSYVKGTVLLVCRKRLGSHKTTRDDLAWELQEEVEEQVEALTGLNQEAKDLYRDENVFEDADLQMAGYAAALRTLTRYAIIDGRDMTAEAIRPRVKGETTFVDELIAFAVDTANQYLVPQGIAKAHWDRLSGAERFYLKML
ncbi:MAG: DUF1156 domain-containing protein, partial [Anaerolineales bacterium]|nr:DUF1156 domain-containing protein [Anaerolineales bacterium]